MKGYTYILQCSNGQYYVGSTTNIDLRMQEHAEGLGGRFTKGNKPSKLVYVEEHPAIEEAFHRERQLHGWSRAKKEALINGQFSTLPDLSHNKNGS